jgi:hypothetical protein
MTGSFRVRAFPKCEKASVLARWVFPSLVT